MNVVALRQLLIKHFNDSELRDLYFDLGIDHESVAAQSKADRARELIAYAQRHGLADRLLAKCHELRSHVDWSQVTQITSPAHQPSNQAAAAGGRVPAAQSTAYQTMPRLEAKVQSSWTNIIAVLGLIIALVGSLAAVVVVPEIRRAIGLDPAPTSTMPSVTALVVVPTAALEFTSAPAPTAIPTSVAAPEPTPALEPIAVTAPTVAPEPAQPAVPAYPCEATVQADFVNVLNVVRDLPDPSAATRDPIQVGTIVRIIDLSGNQPPWYKITDLNQRLLGWIPSEYLVLSLTCPSI